MKRTASLTIMSSLAAVAATVCELSFATGCHRRQDVATQGNASSGAIDASAATAKTPEERRLARQKKHLAAIAAHDAEPLDPVWSASTEKAIREGFNAIDSAGRNQVSALTCRSSTCIATLTFADVTTEKKYVIPYITHGYAIGEPGVGCTKEMTGESEDSASPYKATLIFDCSRQVATR
jgi:hypothetical protein